MQVPCLTAVRDSCSGHKGPEWVRVWVWRSKISSHSNSNSLCFFGCEGAKYPHTQTHAPEAHRLSLCFFCVSLSTNASLWPFLHMPQGRTSSNPHSHFFHMVESAHFSCLDLFHAHNQTHAAFLYAPRRSNWIIWDNPVLGVVILEGFSNRLWFHQNYSRQRVLLFCKILMV